jgi:hypothetical protein
MILVGLVPVFLCVGTLSTLYVPTHVDSRTVPDNLREDRWEATGQGFRIRRLAEDTCGRFPDGVWLDRAHDFAPIEILHADEELRACLNTQVLDAHGQPLASEPDAHDADH